MLSIKLKTFFFCLILTLLTGFGGPILLYFIPGFITYLNIGINLAGSLTILFGAVCLSTAFFLLAGLPGAILSITEASILSFFLVIMSKYDIDGVKTFLGGILILAVVFILSLALFTDENITFQKNIEKTQQEVEEILKKQQPNLKAEEKIKIDVLFKKLKEYIARFFPALMAFGIIITVLFNIIIARFLSIKKGIEIFQPQFSKWQLPEHLVWFFIAAGIFAFILEDPYKSAGENMIFIMAFLYLIQGCSVINYIFSAMDFPYWVRVVFYFLMCLQWYGLFFLSVIGMSDIWLEWRNRFTQKKEQISN
jgi:uncharacterized protein YybS (DUF2232 family)